MPIPTYPKVTMKIPKLSATKNKSNIHDPNLSCDGNIDKCATDCSAEIAPVNHCFDACGQYEIKSKKSKKAKKRHHRPKLDHSKSKIRCFDASGEYNVIQNRPYQTRGVSTTLASYPDQFPISQSSLPNQFVFDAKQVSLSREVKMIAVRIEQTETATEVIEEYFTNDAMIRTLHLTKRQSNLLCMKEFRELPNSLDQNRLPGEIENYLSHFRN